MKVSKMALLFTFLVSTTASAGILDGVWLQSGETCMDWYWGEIRPERYMHTQRDLKTFSSATGIIVTEEIVFKTNAQCQDLKWSTLKGYKSKYVELGPSATMPNVIDFDVYSSGNIFSKCIAQIEQIDNADWLTFECSSDSETRPTEFQEWPIKYKRLQ